MSRQVDLVWMPGLSSRWIELGMLPRLAEPSAARSVLRAAFPCVPAVLEATLLSGQLPRQHGRLGEARFADLAPPTPGALESWPELRLHRRTDLWRALCQFGPASGAVRIALREADEEWGPVSARTDQDHVVMVCGGPSFRPHDRSRRIDLSGFPPSRTLAEGGILRVQALAHEREAQREALLRRPGVERVLAGRGLQLWGADHPQAGDLVAVAEPDWSFVDEAISYGSWQEAPDSPLLLAFGGRPKWPADVHDVRIAPTLARFLGRPAEGFADSALPL